MRKIELLAPAKTAEIGKAAILHGADAVYIGGPAFGARHNAGNSLADIAELVRFAHRYHARIHVTLNTILTDEELAPARQLAHDCWNIGVDALIVQDMGVLELDLPPIEIHASTQCDIRTPEKARFLADVGFSQLVLARELSLDEIAAIRAVLPADVLVEYFVHGALCVAYSGQCYISHAQTGRSANRGDCSQACRLPYTLQDAQGRVITFEKHLLSLKDNNQSANLAALTDVGVQSFKIEGRYKDLAYVKNITSHYRQQLDTLFAAPARCGKFVASSSGKTDILFTPDPDKTFHRGATDYFTHGRQPDIGAFDTPAFVGLPLGTVRAVSQHHFDLSSNSPLANGDGLTYLHQRNIVGLQANSVESLGGNLWRVWPNGEINSFKGLQTGVTISRNRDHAWEQALNRPSAQRRIAVEATLYETTEGFGLNLCDADGIRADIRLACEKQAAKHPELSFGSQQEQIARLGNSEFVLSAFQSTVDPHQFVPSSLLNRLRREAIAILLEQRLASHPRPARRPPKQPPAAFPGDSLSYLGNVLNQAARAFYLKHGVNLVEAAYEAHEELGEVSLMITRHCLRYSFSLCPKQAKGIVGVQGQIRAEPMLLVNGNEKLRLEFDCKACEMHVKGKIKKKVLQATYAG